MESSRRARCPTCVNTFTGSSGFNALFCCGHCSDDRGHGRSCPVRQGLPLTYGAQGLPLCPRCGLSITRGKQIVYCSARCFNSKYDQWHPENEPIASRPDHNQLRNDYLNVAPSSAGSLRSRSRTPPRALCCVCHAERPTHALIPCGHKCLCQACSSDAVLQGLGLNCPVCRQEIESSYRIFG